MTVRPSAGRGIGWRHPRTPSRARRAPTCPSASAKETALHLRADENGMYAAAASGGADRERLAQAARRGVRVRRGAVPREHGSPAGCGIRSSGCERVERDLARRERAGLVEADDVDAGEPLDRRQLVHEHLLPASFAAPTANAIEVTSTRPSGIIAVSDGDRVHDRLHPRAALPRLHPAAGDHHLRIEHEQADRADAPAHPLQHAVDRAAQLRRDQREPLRLARELVRVRVGADARDLRIALARDDDRARQRLVAAALVDGIGLAGEHRLVDLQARASEHHGIGRHLVAGPQDEDVVERRRRAGAISSLGAVAAHAARGAFRSASRSSAAFARNSWTQPMIAFANAARPNSASCHRPSTRRTRKQRADDRR